MKSSAFEQAAYEASTGVKEIDTEIERLKAKRESLEAKKESLQALVHQLLAILPVVAEPISSDGGNSGGVTREEPAAEQHSFADTKSATSQKEEWPAYSSADATSGQTGSERPSFADLLSQGKPYSLRNEGWPASSPVSQNGIREIL